MPSAKIELVSKCNKTWRIRVLRLVNEQSKIGKKAKLQSWVSVSEREDGHFMESVF